MLELAGTVAGPSECLELEWNAEDSMRYISIVSIPFPLYISDMNTPVVYNIPTAGVLTVLLEFHSLG